ncbi:MAG: hypothetical protein K9L87_04665 [Candidatus Omnitrophica bacterium]|nr:hypothetical protein [Candidatus Omnitrophota bacterium]MCF7892522.1 hypothetical protein [Candidatus Omnitrophota bacterium]MCF7895683.1 hypothetical protein [Candidatus Omnitrophota bacterium]MCF7898023.1 hypothetical protein [Candidatus Omnitrophota bacterium]
MKEYEFWLNDGQKKKNSSKFLNQRLEIDEEIIGDFIGKRQATNSFGKTYHYVINTREGEYIFDSKNRSHAEFFFSIKFYTRIAIKKVLKDGRKQYELRVINNPEDELNSL